ncbi:MAG TPA: efflux RND transporter periplasmic adaptor subunit [Longimicrobiaceae bacterium]|nr:efflux RND transporter periplasmic adaptor subunit [Longimicrobiaceae bacterium]
MSRNPWTRLSPRRRLLAAALGALVLLVPLGVFFLRDGADEPRRELRAADLKGMEGMAGMEGMDMSSDGPVHLTAAQMREFGITFGTVEQRTLEEAIRTAGSVTYDETRIAEVAPRFGGFVERLYVDFTGRPVRRGEPLLEIYSPDLVSAQQELLVAARLQRAGGADVPGMPSDGGDLVRAARERLRLWDISDAQIDRVLRTGQVRRTLTLHSPVSGVVVEKPVVRGQAVQPGQTLYTIADLSRVWVEAQVREADAASVQVGSPATVEFAAFPGRPLSGTVEYVYPSLEPEARALRARIALPNPDGRLRPGMYGTVRLSAPSRVALTVPTTAVVRTGERSVVFVDLGGGRILPQEVETGRTAGALTEVLAGLEPGQRVVTSAQFILDSESNLAETMRSMIGMTGSGDMAGMEGMDMSGGGMQGMDMSGGHR